MSHLSSSAPIPDQGAPGLDLESIRAQFPILQTRVRQGRTLAYLDNAASTQQPRMVIETVAEYHRRQHANIHRGVYELSQTATGLYEDARAQVADFIGAAEPAECLFTRGTTESINLVAATWGARFLQPGDEIILSTLEHHSNIVPWQLIAQARGALIKVIPIDDRGTLRLDVFEQLLSPRTRLVAVNQVSNALGTINPVRAIIERAHAAGALVLIDGAQWVAHGPVDVQALDADFYAFSGHKLYGPTGIGVLYGKRALLEAMPPYQGGGDMIEQVSFAGTSFAPIPNKFEAGTPNIAGAIGLARAIEWLTAFDFADIQAHEHALLALATRRLESIPGLRLFGRAPEKAAVLSWVVEDPPIATLDLGARLDLDGICIRTGHHCCQPLMDHLGIAGTARASFALYNTAEEVEWLADRLAALVAEARTARPRGGVSQTSSAEADATGPSDQGEAPRFAPTVAASPQAAADALIEIFDLLPDWPMRHEQILDFGARLERLPEACKTPETAIHGCQSQVHLIARVRPETHDCIEFAADSDAALVRGLIVILQQLFSGQAAADILGFDDRAFMQRIGLDRHLSLGRRNGLDALLRAIRTLAARYATA